MTMIERKILTGLISVLATLILVTLTTLRMSYYQTWENNWPIIDIPPAAAPEDPFNYKCNCTRKWTFLGNAVKVYASSCSDERTAYEPQQNVLSFTMYYEKIDSSRGHYHEGIHLNLAAMRKYFPPDFTMRIYTNEDLDPVYCNMLCKNPELVWCDIRRTPSLGNKSGMVFRTWRFLPLADPSVKTFHSRDLDSVVSHRDASVVNDWLGLKEPKPIYVMRDMDGYHDNPIMAGMWGGDNSLIKDVVKLRDELVNQSQPLNLTAAAKEYDQVMLNRTIFLPRGKTEIVGYDSYHCVKWAKHQSMSRPFPIPRKNNKTDFVGNSNLGRREFVFKKCPVECRPAYGIDWEIC